jgi:hypothetical protein
MLEGASAKDAKARLFLEADGCEYVFNGHISNSKCTIPMGKLKKFANLLESGKIRLEIVADDTLFVPYENTYELEEAKKVTVEVKQPDYTPKKPMVEVKVNTPQQTKTPTKSKFNPVSELKDYFINYTSFDGTPRSFHTLVKDKTHKDFFNTICESYNLDKLSVIKQILK